ncbi:hypothetical protein [Phytobacter diazotrophicus]|uniref:hypothetical protein n=1 Tax=Phytobacter diazotrophicus TaxID=395631 RepID=UPI002FFB80B2
MLCNTLCPHEGCRTRRRAHPHRPHQRFDRPQCLTALPKLDILCALGAGYENIDLSAAKARNITIAHGPGTNDTSVADHAMALLMAIGRGIQVSVR